MAKPRGPVPYEFVDITDDGMPKHVAIIMDGNGRWAKDRGRMRAVGHRAGMERLVHVVRTSSDIGMDVLTLYAFSTENWKRPRPEVEALFSLLVEYIRKEINELHKNNVRLRMIGHWRDLPAAVVSQVSYGCTLTKDNTGMVLCIALNYGGRREIADAARKLAERVKSGDLCPDDIDESVFAGELYTGELPDPDLIIRTGGEQRLSNFLLFQSAYAEFVSVPEFWPDYTNEVYAQCLRSYGARDRRFGDIGGTSAC